MYYSMEDQGQHYDQCVTEVQQCKLLSLQMSNAMGVVVIVTFNDEQISKILSRFDDIGHEYDGKTQSYVILMN